MSSVLQLALHIRGRRACDHRSAKRKSHWPDSVIKAFPRIHCSFIHCSNAHHCSPMIQCFSRGHHGLAGYETKFCVTDRWPNRFHEHHEPSFLSFLSFLHMSYVSCVSWRSWAKPPPAPWRLLGGHPHLDMSTVSTVSTVMSRYPNPSAPWPPMTFLPRSTRVYMSTRPFLHLSTTFTNRIWLEDLRLFTVQIGWKPGLHHRLLGVDIARPPSWQQQPGRS